MPAREIVHAEPPSRPANGAHGGVQHRRRHQHHAGEQCDERVQGALPGEAEQVVGQVVPQHRIANAQRRAEPVQRPGIPPVAGPVAERHGQGNASRHGTHQQQPTGNSLEDLEIAEPPRDVHRPNRSIHQYEIPDAPESGDQERCEAQAGPDPREQRMGGTDLQGGCPPRVARRHRLPPPQDQQGERHERRRLNPAPCRHAATP